MAAIRIVIADDHALFREGLKSLLRLHQTIEVVGEADSLALVDAVLDEVSCDILLLDLQMETWSMDEIPRLVRRTSVILLTANESVETGMTALRIGARAVVHKRFAFDTLLLAINAVADGGVWIPTSIQGALLSEATNPRRLTARELQIVRCVGMGLHNAEIAQRLSVTQNTIKTHLVNIFEKLRVRDRTELVHYAIDAGLIELKKLR